MTWKTLVAALALFPLGAWADTAAPAAFIRLEGGVACYADLNAEGHLTVTSEGPRCREFASLIQLGLLKEIPAKYVEPARELQSTQVGGLMGFGGTTYRSGDTVLLPVTKVYGTPSAIPCLGRIKKLYAAYAEIEFTPHAKRVGEADFDCAMLNGDLYALKKLK